MASSSSPPSRGRLRVGSYNVRSINSGVVRERLDHEMKAKRIDVCGLQETKLQGDERQFQLQDGTVVSFGQQKGKVHWGVGIYISKRLLPFLTTTRKVSDRVGWARFDIKGWHRPLYVITAYAPTLPVSEDNPGVRDRFYAEMEAELRRMGSKAYTFVCGDWNAVVGHRGGGGGGALACLGKWSRGKFNSNGKTLLELAEQQGLLLTNTCFEHKARFLTTFTGTIPRSEGKRLFKQIDFILLHHRYRRMLVDSRSYESGEVDSDHKIVVTTVVAPHKMQYKRPPAPRPRINLERLRKDEDMQQTYTTELAAALPAVAESKWGAIASTIKEVATRVVGTVLPPPRRKGRYIDDPEVAALAARQKEVWRRQLRARSKQKEEFKMERKQLGRELCKMVGKKVKERMYDKAAKVGAAGDDGARMFAAMSELKMYSAGRGGITVHNSAGETLQRKAEQAATVSEFFEGLFNLPNKGELGPMDARPLQKPVTAGEVANALVKLRNGKACGADELNNELFNYGTCEDVPILAEVVAKVVNSMFEKGYILSEIGEGLLVPLQKPGKPRGACGSLRPVVLLNSLRKIFSIIVLDRLRDDAEAYVPNSQSAYRAGRSTADIVFAKRILADTAVTKVFDLHILGIDLSRAFDTVDRVKLMEVLKDMCAKEDVHRMVHSLLADTTLQVRVGTNLADPFKATVGTPQGDSLSPVLFNVYYEAAMKELRAECGPPPDDDVRLGIPVETQYADDLDFISTAKERLEGILAKSLVTFPKWDLSANATKTEWVHLCVDPDKTARGSEPWRSVKSLGSLMGGSEDMERRMKMMPAAMKGLWGLWGTDKVCREMKIKLYEIYCLPVLMYNCGTWGCNNASLEKLDALHRRHLRRLSSVFYPATIRNTKLYELTKRGPLSDVVKKRRWALFGHVLRLPEDAPAQRALDFAFSAHLKGRLGRPPTTLLGSLKKDAKDCTGNKLKTIADLETLRTKAIELKSDGWMSLHIRTAK